jgi:hypothetical protein
MSLDHMPKTWAVTNFKSAMTSHFVTKNGKSAKMEDRGLQMHFLQKEFALGEAPTKM